MKINPDAAGLDAARLERLTEHVDRRYIGPGKIAGCQVAIARHGHVGYWRSFGHADLERGVPVRDDTVWRIYSMTKPITGVALLQLYERGLFQLNDPVHRFIPQWRSLKVREVAADGSTRLVDPERPMTVRDLMMHMSGLGFGGRRPPAELRPRDEPASESGEIAAPGAGMSGAGMSGAAGASADSTTGSTLESFVDDLAARPLRSHPGTRWFYSVSTDICGRLVEVMSGRRFDEYLAAEVFEPLGMVDTGFSVPDDKVDRFAANYRRGPEKELVLADDPATSPFRRTPSFLSGGGGLVSTTADYLRFTRMLLGGGEYEGARVLGPKTVELMATNHLPDSGELRAFAEPGGYGEVGFDGSGFGLTVAVALGPARTQVIGSPGEFMWGGYASTLFWVDPAEDLTVVFMTQLVPSGTFNFRGQLKALVYAAIVD